MLEALKVNKTPASAVNLLVQMGYFQVHENLYLLKLDIPIDFSAKALVEVENIKTRPPYDADMVRGTFSFLK